MLCQKKRKTARAQSVTGNLSINETEACAELEHDALQSEHTPNQHDTTPARPKEARAAARRRLVCHRIRHPMSAGAEAHEPLLPAVDGRQRQQQGLVAADAARRADRGQLRAAERREDGVRHGRRPPRGAPARRRLPRQRHRIQPPRT
jgi:hypothetical protein